MRNAQNCTGNMEIDAYKRVCNMKSETLKGLQREMRIQQKVKK